MQFDYDSINDRVAIIHGDSRLDFDMKLYTEGRQRRETIGSVSPFDLLNKFLSKIDKDRQDTIFNFYLKTRVLLDEERDTTNLSVKLTNEIKKLAKLIPVSEMNNWVKFSSRIYIPMDLKDDFTGFNEKALITRDKTYIRDDYIDLIAWTLCLRFVLPVWSEFVNRTKTEYGTTWKVFYAYYLIAGSDYQLCSACERLERYVEVSIPSDTDLNSAIVDGVSSSDFPRWLISLVVMRRVIPYDIEGGPDTPSLIKVVYKFVNQKLKQIDKSFAGTVRERAIITTNNTSDNNQASTLESYNSRQLLSDGDMVIVEHYLEDYHKVAKHLDPSIPDKLIEEASVNATDIFGSDIQDVQVVLTKYVLNRVISGRVLDFVGRKSLIHAMIIARAWYWHHGYKDLALLCSAVKLDASGEFQVTGSEKRQRIVKDLSDELEKYFPYYLKTTGKKQEKPKLAIIQTIEHMERLLTLHEWRVTVADTWIEEMGLHSRHYAVPDDIKISLVRLALELAKNPPLSSPY